MLIRRLVIASLMAGAATAQAGNIPTQAAAPSNVVTGWTTGDGTDVLASGVLQGNMNLVAGVAHSADASLSDLLMGKVSANLANVDGQTKLFFQRGIEANYLLASGHGILAATQGPGTSVVADADGAIISKGVAKSPGQTGGGNNTTSNTGNSNTGNSNSGNANTGNANTGNANTGNANTGNANTGNSNNGNANANTGNNNSGNANGNINNGNINNGNGNTGNNGNGLGNVADADAAQVPEPSSIALMLLGMVGAGAMTRRRNR